MAIITRQAIAGGQFVIQTETVGLDEAIRAAHRYTDNAVKALAGAMYREMLLVEGESKRRTPVDLGTLQDSHFTHLPVINGTEIMVETGTGGPAAGYALYVHEDLEAFHDDGEAKFLANAMNSRAPGMSQRMADDIRSEARA